MPKTYEAQPGLERSAACPDRHNNPEYERKKHSMVQKTRQAVLHCMDKHNIQAFVMPGAQCDPWSAAQLPEVVVPIGFLPENRKLVDEASSMTDEKVPYAEKFVLSRLVRMFQWLTYSSATALILHFPDSRLA